MPLEKIPGYGGYSERSKQIEDEDFRKMQTLAHALAIQTGMENYRTRQQVNQVLRESGGDPKRMRDLVQRLATVDPKAAETIADIINKLEIKTGTTPHVMMQGGEPRVGVFDTTGNFRPSPGLEPQPKFRELNLGGTTALVNERALPPEGGTFHRTPTDVERDRSDLGWAGLNRPELRETARGFEWLAPPRVEPRVRLGPGTMGYGGDTAPGVPRPVPGPVADRRPQPMTEGLRRDLRDSTTQADLMQQQIRNFRPQYGGSFIMGGLENTLKRWFPTLEDVGGTKGQADWWSAMTNLDSLIRHPLFGSQFTLPERKIWADTTVSPRDDPSVIRRNLLRRGQVLENVLNRIASSAAVRHDKKEIEELVKRAIRPDTAKDMDEKQYREALIRAIEGARRQGGQAR